jgi:hypothetical protein
VAYITRRPGDTRLERAVRKVLSDPRNSKAWRMAHGVALTQRPKADYDDWLDRGGPDQITVHESDNGPQWTGLLDQHGNELCRVADRLPMGFRLK